jgi:hypothetical protein
MLLCVPCLSVAYFLTYRITIQLSINKYLNLKYVSCFCVQNNWEKVLFMLSIPRKIFLHIRLSLCEVPIIHVRI